jgi:hypothetical protein
VERSLWQAQERTEVAKYDPLETYLRRRAGAELELSFADIERIVGAMLPNSASRPQWWANETDPASSHVQCRAWRNAGYDAFLLPGGRVLFSRRAAS